MRGAVKYPATEPSRRRHRPYGKMWLAAHKYLSFCHGMLSPLPPGTARFHRTREFSSFSSCDSLLTSTWSGPSWAPPDVLLGYSWRHFDCSWSTLDCYLSTSQRVDESTGPRVHGSTGLRVNGYTSHGPRDRARWPVRGAAPVR